MRRAIVLSLVMLFAVGVMLPLSTDWSEASRPQVRKKQKKVKKYSKAWWRAYRAKQRRQRQLAVRKRALAERRKQMAKAREEAVTSKPAAAATAQYVPVLGNSAPNNWQGQVAADNNGELQFRVADTDGQQIGSAQLSVVGPAMPSSEDNTSARARSKTLGGVSVSALRRTVIDRMIKEQGWVVNDYQREVGGRRVFVVVAQSPAGGAVNSRLFYFTEVDGRIYSLATNSANDFSEKVAADSEKVLSAMHRNGQPTQQATSSGSDLR